MDFRGFAASAGYPNCFAFSDLGPFEREIPSVLGLTGPVFAALDVVQGKPPVLDYEIMHGDKTREAFQAALNAK